MSLDLQAELSTSYIAARTAARAGEYQLLLGAGASVGAVNGRGEDVPLASGLVQVLRDRYRSAPIAADSTLQRAYQRAVSVSSHDDVWHTLKAIFFGANHQPWFVQLSGLPWRRVWTLNVDDAFENSYEHSLRSSVMAVRTVDWMDPFSERSELEVIHLHGRVNGPDPSPLVFSFSEYQAAAQVRPVWDNVLAGSLASKPFVIIGARLLDDPDVESLIMSNPPQSSAPSFVVDPFIDEGNRWELERLGYIVLRVSGETFVRSWVSGFGLDSNSLDLLYSASTIDIPQFQKLETNRVAPLPRSHDFLGGSEPLWADACDKRVAGFEWMAAVQQSIFGWFDQPVRKPTVHLLYGDRLVGMSSGLLEIARNAKRKSVDVVIFDRSTRFNVDRVLDYCHGRGPVLLIIDGVHEFAQDVDQLADRAQDDSSIEIYVLIADRPNRDLKIENQLVGRYVRKGARINAHRSKRDAQSIVEVLGGFGRLGSLEPMVKTERIRHFAGRDIFSSMADVELGIGFRARMLSEVDQLAEAWHRSLLFLLALAAVENNQVGVQEASFALGVSSSRILQAVKSDSHLGALVEVVGELLLPRQRTRAIAALLDGQDESTYLAALTSMLRGLAPLATNQSLRERNRAAVLVGRLMNAKALRATFPRSDIDKFYEELRPTFGEWNARYWEQRAINARHNEDWAPAESFAARAVSLYDDAFTRTTLGTILINKAASLAESNEPAWSTYYTRGQSELVRAMGKDARTRVTSFAYLESTLSLVKTLVSRPEVVETPNGSLSFVLKDWVAAYAVMRIGLKDDQGFESGSRAEELRRRYDLVTGGVDL